MTRPFAEVIGDPISHSKSPLIHGFWLTHLGIDAEYRACHVRPDELADYCLSRRADAAWRGCNVTLPHKETVARLVDRIDPGAVAIGAVNTVVRQSDGELVGHNTDVAGVAEAISGLASRDRPVVVIGAGGAARAAFACLAGMGFAEVRALARSPDKARVAAGDCGLPVRALPFAPGSGAFDGAGLVINATQLGMTGQAEMPEFVVDGLSRLAADALVFDMVYAPLETALLAAARAKGLRVADGLVMLVGQAATAFARFFRQPPPRERDDELRRLLTA